MRSRYACSSCGHIYPRWVGRCAACGEWGTVTEKGPGSAAAGAARPPRRLLDESGDTVRISTGIGELDRVLGGGIVGGEVILLAGEPGIGKSTLTLAAAASVAGENPVLYVTGEESFDQVRLRANRLGLAERDILVSVETSADGVVSLARESSPSLVVVDSIQMMRAGEIQGITGSVSQVRLATGLFLETAKETGIPFLIVGHVTKGGDVAGPMSLEHMVDAVLLIEMDSSGGYRILRSAKNRFGSTDEVGIFRMTERGMEEVPDPSEILLAGRGCTEGSVIFPSMEGSRALLVEVQALVVPTRFPSPRRLVTGLDPARIQMLLAVMERRGGISLADQDTFINSAGGLRVTEPASDLAAVAAMASAMKELKMEEGTAVFGEVGLGGEIRSVPRVEARVREAARLGFGRIILPKNSVEGLDPRVADLVGVSGLKEAMEILFG